MPKVGDRGTKRLRENYQDSRVEDGVFGAGISHRMSLPYRSNSQARSFARRLELNPVTYRTLGVRRVEGGVDDDELTSCSKQNQQLMSICLNDTHHDDICFEKVCYSVMLIDLLMEMEYRIQ
jgi:hypothetical protein